MDVCVGTGGGNVLPAHTPGTGMKSCTQNWTTSCPNAKLWSPVPRQQQFDEYGCRVQSDGEKVVPERTSLPGGIRDWDRISKTSRWAGIVTL